MTSPHISQCFSPELFIHRLYIYHLITLTETHSSLCCRFTFMPWRAQEHLRAFVKGCKLEKKKKKIPYILEHVNTWDILESKLPLGGYFSWCNLKCSCWDGGIKVQASSLIWFFKLLQRESAVGGGRQSQSFFLRGVKPGECLIFDFINWTLTYPKWAKIIHRVHSNIHSERSVIHNSVRRSWFGHHVCVINKICTWTLNSSGVSGQPEQSHVCLLFFSNDTDPLESTWRARL